jgi:hypothetical protein
MYLVCTEELLEDFPGRGALGQPERRTGEQEAGGSIHDSERVDEGATILLTRTSGVAVGVWCGLRDSSSSEASPRRGEKRLTHLWPV